MERKHNPDLTENARKLRKNMTKEERHLWYDFLKIYPIRFLRQKVIDNYIVDFYCHQARLIIELDGSQHYEPKEELRDAIRTQRLEERNLTVIRIPNNAVNENFRGVCEYIDMVVKGRNLNPPGATRHPPLGKGGKEAMNLRLAAQGERWWADAKHRPDFDV